MDNKNTQKLTSPSNQHVKDWVKLETKRGRKKQGKYLLDGWHLVKEALNSNESIIEIIYTQDFKHLDEIPNLPEVEKYEITPAIAHKLSDTPSPQGIFATIDLVKLHREDPEKVVGPWLLLDQVQDPGNIGTMVRTADAAGFSGVVFGNGTADLFQPKVVRAMQGGQFHISITSGDLSTWISAFKKRDFPVFGSELNKDAKSYDSVGKHENFALIMGNEGNGMQKKHLEQTSANLYIPIKGHAESLNVAVAAGVLMFQLRK